MIRFLNIFSLLLIILMPVSPALAAADAQGAQELKAMFNKLIERQKDAYKISGTEFRTTGDVMVEPAGNYYAITLPNITTLDANGSRAELGMIAINAIPSDVDGQWKMSIAWPSPITFINKQGKPELKIDIGAQRMAGLFDKRMENFIKMDAAYQNVRVENYEKDNIITMPKISIKYNLEEKQPGIFSGPLVAAVEKVTIRDGKQNELLYIDNANLKVDVSDISIADNKAMQDGIKDMAGRVEESDGTATGEDKVAFLDLFNKAFESMGNGFTSQYTINNIRVNLPENSGTNKATKVELSNVGFGLDMTGFKDNNVTLNMRFGYQGLQMTPEPPSFQDVGPQTIKLDLSVKDVPFQELTDMAENSLQTSLQNPAAAQMAKVQAMMAIPQLLTASGTNLTINAINFKSKIASADFEGKVTADTNAASGGTGYINGTMYGLDEFMNIAQQAAIEDKNKERKSNMAKLFPALVLLRGTAEQERKADGTTAYKFRMTLDKDGQVMINNTSIDAIRGAAGQ